MKDFSSTEPVRQVQFKIDQDIFDAAPVCPGGAIADLSQVVKIEDNMEKLQAILDFFDLVLLPDSAALFNDRLRDPSNPIGFNTALSVFEHLVEVYTNDSVPTKAPSSSQSGRTRTGSSSSTKRRSGAATRTTPASDDA